MTSSRNIVTTRIRSVLGGLTAGVLDILRWSHFNEQVMSHIVIEEDNIFRQMRKSFGQDCYKRKSKIKSARNFLYKYVAWQGHYKAVVKRIVREALDYHRNNLDELAEKEHLNEGRPNSCSDQSVLSLAAHLCQKYNLVNERSLVQELLIALFDCDKGFDRFMTFLDPLTFPFEINDEIYPFHCDVSTGTLTPRHLKVLEYFLGVASSLKVKVKFSSFDFTSRAGSYTSFVSEVPFVDVPVPACRGSTPLLLACHSISPEAVLLLLRHGADPFRPGQVHHIIGLQFQHPLYVLVTKLNASVFWMTHNHHLDPAMREQFMTKQATQDVNLKLCLRYFARAVTRLPVVLSNHATTDNVQRNVFQMHPHFKELIPEERLVSPAELSHLCRGTIRRVIRTHNILPSGIYQLPLPNLLKNYLDLLTD